MRRSTVTMELVSTWWRLKASPATVGWAMRASSVKLILMIVNPDLARAMTATVMIKVMKA